MKKYGIMILLVSSLYGMEEEEPYANLEPRVYDDCYREASSEGKDFIDRFSTLAKEEDQQFTWSEFGGACQPPRDKELKAELGLLQTNKAPMLTSIKPILSYLKSLSGADKKKYHKQYLKEAYDKEHISLSANVKADLSKFARSEASDAVKSRLDSKRKINQGLDICMRYLTYGEK